MLGKLSAHLRQHYAGFIAIFIALGGVSYAATQIDGTTLKDRSVAGSKLKRDTATGTEIRESTLSTLPRAAVAARTSSEPWHKVGRAPAPVSSNCFSRTWWHGAFCYDDGDFRWENYGGGYETAAFYKDATGIVRLRGVVHRIDEDCEPPLCHGNGEFGTILLLPKGYCPTGRQTFTVASGEGAGQVDVTPQGSVIYEDGDAGFVSLAQVSFRAATCLQRF